MPAVCSSAALRPDGAGVDCVKLNGQPIFMPGGGSLGANPVADGSQFTVDVAWHTWRRTHDRRLLAEIIDKLVATMKAAPRNPKTGLIHIKPGGYDRCPYGFTDTIRKQGDELFCSLLYIQACRQLGDLLEAAGRKTDAKHWRDEAARLVPVLRTTFWDEQIGLFCAATVLCKQPDIWGSAFAVYLDVATPEQAKTIARYFRDHYGEIVEHGQIRHLPGGMYWDLGWRRNTYQNGGYWATATGWFVYTLDLVDPQLAEQTIIDMVDDVRHRGVSEWVLGPHLAVMNYLASATMPLAGVERMMARRGTPLTLAEVTPPRSPTVLTIWPMLATAPSRPRPPRSFTPQNTARRESTTATTATIIAGSAARRYPPSRSNCPRRQPSAAFASDAIGLASTAIARATRCGSRLPSLANAGKRCLIRRGYATGPTSMPAAPWQSKCLPSSAIRPRDGRREVVQRGRSAVH